jgi:predicted RNase H-like nuclease
VAVLGVDGWRGAWVGALLDGRAVTLLAPPDTAAVLAVPDVDVIGIDMPIGLSDDGPRTCDVEARRRLTGAASSVFPAPVRPVLQATTYDEARTISQAACRRSLSVQTFALVPSIRSLDDALGDPPDPRVHEVHPELSFRALDGRVTDRKASGSGLAQRIRALETAMDVLDALARDRAGLPMVDALDACVAAWSARRILDGAAESVGDGANDSRGRPMRISW